MVSTATVVVKATGATREVAAGEPIVLDAASTVSLQLDPGRVSTISRAGAEGRDLLIVLDDGTQILVSNYYLPDDAGTLSELVLEDGNGAQWWLRSDPETGGYLLVGEETIPVASALTASDAAAAGVAQAAGPSGLAIGIGLGALALGAAAAGGGGGGGGGGAPTPTPTPPVPPDTTPPARPTAQINETGSTISGTAEPASNVRVYDAAGNVIGSAIAGANGSYTITLNPPRIAGEQLTVTATDAAGNESAPISLTAPDLTDNEAPDAPTAVINATGDTVSGTAEIGATVNVFDSAGNVIGTGVAGTDGRYTITLDPPLTAGEALTVTATDAAGNESAPIALTAPDLTDVIPPDAPTAVINATGDTVSGTAEIGATVNVFDAAGNVIGTGVAGTNGRYTITLDPPLTAGEALTVTATDAAGNESAPVSLIAPDLTDVIPPDAPTAVINANGDTVSGTAEIGATVNVFDADDNVIGTGVAGTDGRYTIALDPALIAGEALTVTATDAAGNESAPVSLIAPDLTDVIPPDAPTAVINATGDTVSGTAEIGATVNVFDADGTNIGTGVAGTDGRYTITLDPALTAGEALTVTATDAAGNESAPIALTAPDLTDVIPPDAPTAVINATGDTVSGTAEIGATVNVFDADGTSIGTGIAGTDGRYTITLDPALTAGEALTVTATDAAGNESAPIALTAPDLSDNTAPEPPIAAVTPTGDAVTGTAEIGATVTVFDADGNILGTGVAGTNGRFTIPLEPPSIAGESLTVTATDAAGNESGPTAVTAPDLSDIDVPPSPTAAVSAAGDAVSGSAEAGATVTVYDAAGNVLGSVEADSNGAYTIPLDPPLIAGEQLSVTATNAGGESYPTTIFAPDLADIEAPAAPTAVINDEGDTVTGRAEAGSTVQIRDTDGNLLGSGVADTDGRYTISLDPPLTAGEQLSVTAVDAAGNVSDPTLLTAPDLTDVEAPAAPTAAINDAGDTITGLAEGGSTVVVRDTDGNLLGTGVAATDGRYSVTLDPPQTAGEQLSVTAVDAAGNVSEPTLLTAPDLTDIEAPAAPTAAINDAGDTVTGLAETGSTVEVRDAEGNLLGSGAAGTDGRYTITLDPPLTAGEQLSVTAVDAAGNSSDPTLLTAPDLTDVDAPAAPTAAINDAGDTVTGQAEVGSTVEVRDLDGNLLGSGTAGTDGRYTVSLNPALTAGEQLSVTAVDAAGNVSAPTLLTAPDLTDVEAPAAPTAAINDTGDTVTGLAEAGTTVEVRDADGNLLAAGTAGTDGRYSITLDPPLTGGEQLSVTAVDAAGNVSDPTLLTAPDLTDVEAPAAPSAAINDTGDTVSGQAEIGATVEVRDPDGNLLGSGVAGPSGFYTITLDPPLTAGEQLSVTAVDAAGNVSDPTLLTAPDLTDVEAPAAPTATINDAGDTVTGQAEIGSTVEVRDLDGNLLGSGIAGTGGFYTITLDPPLTAGEQLSVTAVDAAGNVSDPTLLTAPDLDVEAPDAPTAMINAAGDTVSGQAEENSTVTVRDADGTVLGTAVAGPDGGYAIVLDPPLTGGERLSVTATDPAGNVSDPTLINAPNISDNIIAYDDIATANLDIVPATQNVALGSAAYLLLVSLSGLNLQATVLGTESVSFSVGQGRELDAVFDYSALLTAGVLGNYQVVVQRWDGTQWTGIDGNDQATLLELNLLTGNAQAEAPDLGPGEYRAFMTFNGIGAGLLGALSVGGVESDFTVIADVVGDAISGNVVTDGGGDVVTPTTVVQSVNGQVVDGTVEIVGQYGVLQIDASGAYTYVPNEVAANIGQVDQFVYTLFDSVTGNTSSATLFVRIDSGDVDLTWDDANPGAPATFDFAANGDTGAAGVEFANVTGDLYDDSANLALTLINPSRTYVSQTFSVSDSMEVSGTASINLLVALASNGSLALQQQTTTGAWVNVGSVVTYSVLLGVVGTAAEIDLAALDLGAGTYRFRATVGGVAGLNANVSIDVNATYLDQFEVAGVDTAIGNLLANDVPGSGFTQLQVFDNATDAYVDVPAGATVTIQGQYGALNVDAGGNYVYTPDGNSSFFGAPVSESFEYRLLHPTGQIAQGELVVTVEPGGAGVNSVVESFDLEAMAIEDAQVDSDAGNDAVSGEFDASALFGAMAYEAPILVRGEGGEVIALDVPQVGGLPHAPMWEAEYGVPLRQEDETDTLLAQQTTSAL